MKQPEFYHSATASAWFWRVKTRNGRTVADSGEGYSSEAKARQGFKSAARIISSAAPAAGKRVTSKASRKVRDK